MLASIAEAIAERNMSIEDVTTEIRRGKNNGRDFVINAEVVTTEHMDQEHLDSLLAELQKNATLGSFAKVNLNPTGDKKFLLPI